VQAAASVTSRFNWLKRMGVQVFAIAPDGFDAALVLVGGDKVQSSLSLVRQGGIIAFPNGVMPEPKAPEGVELKKAIWLRRPSVVRPTQPIGEHR
jgi:hypothetical protein